MITNCFRLPTRFCVALEKQIQSVIILLKSWCLGIDVAIKGVTDVIHEPRSNDVRFSGYLCLCTQSAKTTNGTVCVLHQVDQQRAVYHFNGRSGKRVRLSLFFFTTVCLALGSLLKLHYMTPS